ncbi:MAG: hypothetical protein Q9182_003005 [Xanthomendoza sp. 2 TL-2023]
MGDTLPTSSRRSESTRKLAGLAQTSRLPNSVSTQARIPSSSSTPVQSSFPSNRPRSASPHLQSSTTVAAPQTASHPAYVDNGLDRQRWPKILFQYQPTRADFTVVGPSIRSQTPPANFRFHPSADPLIRFHPRPVQLPYRARLDQDHNISAPFVGSPSFGSTQDIPDDRCLGSSTSAFRRLPHFTPNQGVSLGLTKVKDACEKIQQFGAYKDETGRTVVASKVGGSWDFPKHPSLH